jgi:hypothetical protein
MKSLIVGIVLFLLLGVAALYFSGILQVDNSTDEVNISVDKRELEAETEEAIQEAKENSRRLRRRVGEALEETGESLKEEDATHVDDVEATP